MAQPSRLEVCQDAETHLYHVLVKERPGNEAYTLHFWTAMVELNMGGWLASKRLLHNMSVQLPHGFYTCHLDSI